MNIFKKKNKVIDDPSSVKKFNHSHINVTKQIFITDIPKGEHIAVTYPDITYYFNSDIFTEKDAVEEASRLRNIL